MNFLYRPSLKSALALVGFIAFAPAASWASERKLHSHEHGVSTLKVVQEGNVIAFELEAPGMDTVGFESEPANAAQSKAVQDALAVFKTPLVLFATPDAAGCKAALDEAEFEMEDSHAGFHVKWKLECSDVTKIKSLSTTFFDEFPNAKEIDVQLVGGAGQTALEAKRGASTIDLSNVVGM